MTEEQFIPQPYTKELNSGKITWHSPSNIALVKYWGKRENQLPENPSLSFTLNNCKTITTLSFNKKASEKKFDFQIYLDGINKVDFEPKIETFFNRIQEYVPLITEYAFKIETKNTFPHSSGIASSASGMSALSLCLLSIEQSLLKQPLSADHFNKKASFLARLGSGSASRSIEGELMLWGSHKAIQESNDFFAIKYRDEIHDVFKNYRDTILLVDKGEKEVSSSLGHNLMHGHQYAKERFAQAHLNITKMKEILKLGDLQKFIQVVESEALTLHAMMMTSIPYFILMKPNTLEIINKIWDFRKRTNYHLCFTLDAGANVHLLYPKHEAVETLEFIKGELVRYCENGNYIEDEIGAGAYQSE